jgi:acyl-CoA thioester hydrolase
MLTQHDIEFRVRYQETDGQARVHHANYFTYFEMGRTELLRAAGTSYRALEESGIVLVVAEISCRYYLPADYDDLLRLRTRTVSARGARIEHTYHVFRGQELLAEGRSVLACINRQGRPMRIPKLLALDADDGP